MKPLLTLTSLALAAALFWPSGAFAQRSQYEEMVARHAQANGVPVALVHRVIVRESRYNASLVGRGGTIGLMQIKLSTARSLGYTGTAEGLRDPATNLMYGIKYLAGAFRAANGNHDRAVHYYAAGYYFAAKLQRIEHLQEAKAGPTTAPPKELPKDEIAAAADDTTAKDSAEAAAEPAPAPHAGDSDVKAR